MEHIIVPIIGFTVCGVIGYAIGRCLKVKRTDMAFIWGALLGPIGWIIVVFLEKDNGDGAAHTFSHNNWADTVVCISCTARGGSSCLLFSCSRLDHARRAGKQENRRHGEPPRAMPKTGEQEA